MMSVTKLAFWDGHILEELEWNTMVIIPNSGWGYIGIGLVEVIWKVCASIMNNRLQNDITLPDSLHGFR